MGNEYLNDTHVSIEMKDVSRVSKDCLKDGVLFFFVLRMLQGRRRCFVPPFCISSTTWCVHTANGAWRRHTLRPHTARSGGSSSDTGTDLDVDIPVQF